MVVDGHLGEHDVSVADQPHQAGTYGHGRSPWKRCAQQIAVEVVDGGGEDPEPTAADDACPVPVTVPERIRFAARNDQQSTTSGGRERGERAADVVDQLGIVDDDQHAAVMGYVIDDLCEGAMDGSPPEDARRGATMRHQPCG